MFGIVFFFSGLSPLDDQYISCINAHLNLAFFQLFGNNFSVKLPHFIYVFHFLSAIEGRLSRTGQVVRHLIFRNLLRAPRGSFLNNY